MEPSLRGTPSELSRIRADNGDALLLYYWSVLQGFHQLKAGQRVEFSRGVGVKPSVANLVVADVEQPD